MGSATVSKSDPPACTNFDHVWVTVDAVSASISTSDSGWQPLVEQLDSSSGSMKAVQLDLMNLPQSGQCLLAQMGSTQSLPVGDYQQIRLQLVPNGATGVTLLSVNGDTTNTTNQCGGSTWDCVVPTGGSITLLNLASEAQTGLKIPPGQVMGGPIHVASGQSVDIDLDFNACRSIVAQGNGWYILSPALVAYQVSQNLTGISGQVVQGSVVSNALQVTTNPVEGANVALETPTNNPTDGSSAVDLIGNYLRTTDAGGNFDFCPLPAGPFDIVANAGSSTTTTGNYNATIVTGVLNGTKVTVPLTPETGGPAMLSGLVTATAADGTAKSISANVYALQTATTSLEFAVPLLSGSNPELSQVSVPCTSGSSCTTVSPVFSLFVPASRPN